MAFAYTNLQLIQHITKASLLEVWNSIIIYNKLLNYLGLQIAKSKIIHIALPQDDPKQRKPDISLAKK